MKIKIEGRKGQAIFLKGKKVNKQFFLATHQQETCSVTNQKYWFKYSALRLYHIKSGYLIFWTNAYSDSLGKNILEKIGLPRSPNEIELEKIALNLNPKLINYCGEYDENFKRGDIEAQRKFKSMQFHIKTTMNLVLNKKTVPIKRRKK